MNLTRIKARDLSKVYSSLADSKKLTNISSLLLRVLMQMKRFLEVHSRSMGTNNWSAVNKIIASTFKNSLYFNRSMIGGNKNYFEKLVDNETYHPNQPIEAISEVQFELNQSSILYDKGEKAPFIVALGSKINPFSSCMLSFCCRADLSTL